MQASSLFVIFPLESWAQPDFLCICTPNLISIYLHKSESRSYTIGFVAKDEYKLARKRKINYAQFPTHDSFSILHLHVNVYPRRSMIPHSVMHSSDDLVADWYVWLMFCVDRSWLNDLSNVLISKSPSDNERFSHICLDIVDLLVTRWWLSFSPRLLMVSFPGQRLIPLLTPTARQFLILFYNTGLAISISLCGFKKIIHQVILTFN